MAASYKEGEMLDFGGLLGKGPIMKVNSKSSEVMINRGGRIPAPMQSLKNYSVGLTVSATAKRILKNRESST